MCAGMKEIAILPDTFSDKRNCFPVWREMYTRPQCNIHLTTRYKIQFTKNRTRISWLFSCMSFSCTYFGYNQHSPLRTGGDTMNCFQHTDVTAVATCAQGCGRSLCPECAEEFEPPTCNICASAIKNNTIAEVTQERSTIIKRMVINAVFLLAYVFLFINAQKNNQNPAVLWVMIPIFIWGLIAYRWLK